MVTRQSPPPRRGPNLRPWIGLRQRAFARRNFWHMPCTSAGSSTKRFCAGRLDARQAGRGANESRCSGRLLLL